MSSNRWNLFTRSPSPPRNLPFSPCRKRRKDRRINRLSKPLLTTCRGIVAAISAKVSAGKSKLRKKKRRLERQAHTSAQSREFADTVPLSGKQEPEIASPGLGELGSNPLAEPSPPLMSTLKKFPPPSRGGQLIGEVNNVEVKVRFDGKSVVVLELKISWIDIEEARQTWLIRI